MCTRTVAPLDTTVLVARCWPQLSPVRQEHTPSVSILSVLKTVLYVPFATRVRKEREVRPKACWIVALASFARMEPRTQSSFRVFLALGAPALRLPIRRSATYVRKGNTAPVGNPILTVTVAQGIIVPWEQRRLRDFRVRVARTRLRRGYSSRANATTALQDITVLPDRLSPSHANQGATRR